MRPLLCSSRYQGPTPGLRLRTRSANFETTLLAVALVLLCQTQIVVSQFSGTPEPPSNLVATTTGSLRFGMTWTKPTNLAGVDRYYLRISGDGGSTFQQLAELGSDFTSYTVSFGLDKATNYIVRIYSGRCCAPGTPAPTTGCTVLDSCTLSATYSQDTEQAITEPNAITNLVGSVGGDEVINLAWTTPSDTGANQQDASVLTSYQVIRATDSGFTQDVVITNDIAVANSYNVLSLTAGVTYHFIVKPNNLAGAGPNTVTNYMAIGIPSQPVNLTHYLPFANGIVLNWTQSVDTGAGNGAASTLEPILEYQLQMDGSNVLDNTLATGHVLSNLARGTDRVFRVRSRNRAGFSPWSSTVTGFAVGVPSAPALMYADIHANRSIKVSWTAPSDTGASGSRWPLTSYFLEMDSSLQGSFQTTTNITELTLSNSTNQYIFTALVKRPERYYFRLRALNQFGSGSTTEANQRSVEVPSAPPQLNASVVGVRQISLSWLAPTDTGVTGTSFALGDYALEMSTAADWSNISSSTPISNSETSIVVDVPASGLQQYYFRLLASNVLGFSAPSPTASEQGVHLPSPPTNFTIEPPFRRAYTFFWSIPDDTGLGVGITPARPLTGFIAAVSGDSIQAYNISLPPDIRAYNLTDLSPGVLYTYTMYSVNDAGVSAESAVSYTQFLVDSPTQVRNLTVNVTGENSISLSWRIPEDTGRGGTAQALSSYNIELNDGSGTSTLVLGANTFFYEFSSLTEQDTPYSFSIFAVNPIGTGTVLTRQEYAIVKPSSMQDLSISTSAPLELSVQWQRPNNTGTGSNLLNLTRQIVHVSRTADFATHETFELQDNILQFKYTAPAASATPYFFRLQAENAVGKSNFSTTVSEQAITLPSSPSNVTAGIRGEGIIEWNWEASSDTGLGDTSRPLFAQHLQVRESPVSNYSLPFFENTTFPAFDSSLVLTGLTKGKSYTLRVFAINSAGPSVASLEATANAISVPSAPTSPSATVFGELGIKVEWQLPADTGFGDSSTTALKNYTVFVDTDQSMASKSEVYTGASSHFVYTSSTAGVTYYFAVLATNEAGSGPVSNVVNQQSQVVPSQPRNFAVNISRPLVIDTTWQHPNNTGAGIGVTPTRHMVQYTLQISAGDSSFASPTNVSIVYNATSFDLSGLVKGTLYYLRIIAVNDAGSSLPSAVRSEHGVVVPATIGDLSAVASKPLTAVLSWTPPSDTGIGDSSRPLHDYLLEIDENGDFAGTDYTRKLVHLSSSYEMTGLLQNGSYYFRLSVRNDAGYSIPSSVVVVTALTVPSKPLNPSAIANSPFQISFSWEMPADTGRGNQGQPIIEYVVQESKDDSAFSSPTNITASGSQFSISRQSLVKGSVYFYRVLAVNLAGGSSFSVIVSEQAIDVPSIPLFPKANVTAPLAIDLQWEAPSDTGRGIGSTPSRNLTNYLLLTDITSSAMNAATTQVIAANQTSITLTQLVKGRRYWFAIRAVNSAGQSNMSAIVNEQGIEVPTYPGQLASVVTNPGEFRISFDVPADTGAGGTTRKINQYIVEMDTQSSFASSIVILANSTVTSKIQSGLDIGSTYFFRVLAENDAGKSAWSPTISQESITIPSAPRNASIHITGPQKIELRWATPVNTGFNTDNANFLTEYIVEMQSSNSTLFTSSPFGSSGVCYSLIGCDPTASSSLEVSRQSTTVYLRTSVPKAQQLWFRVVARNAAGVGNSTVVLSEQGVVLPSKPEIPQVGITGQGSITMYYQIPLETGIGGQLRPILQYRVEYSLAKSFATPILVDMTANLQATFSNASRATLYFFRAAAINSAGQGDWSDVVSNGPELTSLSPATSPAVGGTEITFRGIRLGSVPGVIDIVIGGKVCDSVRIIISDLVIACRSPPQLPGRYNMSLSVQGLKIEFDSKIGYNAPEVTALQPSTFDLANNTNQLITILGRNFGVENSSPLVSLISESTSSFQQTIWVSDSTLLGVTPRSTSKNNTVTVKVKFLSSLQYSKGSLLLLPDVPDYLKCSKSADEECYECCEDKCYTEFIQRAMEGKPGPLAGDVHSYCEFQCMEHCGFNEAL